MSASPHRRRPRVVVRDAVIVSVVCAVAALGVNAVRGDGIRLIADQPYQILVPCPEPLGEVDPIAPSAALRADDGVLVLDARDDEAFAAWHVPDARHVMFDWLDPLGDETIADLAATGARRIVVYGDAGDPDSGRELARELAGRGLRNVVYVEGGAPALRRALGVEPADGDGPADAAAPTADGEEVTP